MIWYALKMLLGDPVKYAGLIFGIAFSTLLITQQATIFGWLAGSAANPIINVAEAQVWVMDNRVRTIAQPIAMADAALERVRGVKGVAWAAPYFSSGASAQTRDGRVVSLTLIGLDPQSFVGAPRDATLQALQSLRAPGALMLDVQTVGRIWPGISPQEAIGRTLEINDKRVVVTALADPLPGFGSNNTGLMSYSQAVAILPSVRNTLSFVLAAPVGGVTPDELATRIESNTNLKASARAKFIEESLRETIGGSGILPGFAVTILLGVIVGLAITGLTLSLFVTENIRQFGALKALGVTNGQIMGMLFAQCLVVGVTGFGLGIGGTLGFVKGAGGGNGPFEGIVLYGEVVWVTAALMAVIIALSAALSIRKVLKLDPAVVFR
jgi:putative ABC transport system permease protein